MNKNEKEDKAEILRQGIPTRFWEIIKETLVESIEHINKQLDEDCSELPPEEYKSKRELLKAKVEFIDTLSKTPENIISWLQEPDDVERDFDPYQK